MATIANQIKRISDSRDKLRNKGKALGLIVPGDDYWDESTNTYKSYDTAALSDSDQIDKIAAAFNTINLYRDINGKNEIRVPISVRTDNETTVVETTTLAPGYYYNTTIVPFVKVEQVEDIVINVEMIHERVLTDKSAIITPSNGFNYIGLFGYTITPGAVDTTNAGYGNNFVIAKIKTSGWVDADTTTNINVPESTLTSKIGSNAETTITTNTEILPNALNDTVLTIGAGIYGSIRTITIKSVASSQGGGDIHRDYILEGYKVFINGQEVTGTMPNYGGTSDSDKKQTSIHSYFNNSGYVSFTVSEGYYNEYSILLTSILYNPDRIFDTIKPTTYIDSTDSTDTMTSRIYYESLPEGYYNSIIRKIEVLQGIGEYTGITDNKVIFKISKPGWFDVGERSFDINAGPALYKLMERDISESNLFTIIPEQDVDGTKTTYLTQVTIDNTLIYNKLAEI